MSPEVRAILWRNRKILFVAMAACAAISARVGWVMYSNTPLSQFRLKNEAALQACEETGKTMCEFNIEMLTE